MKMQNVKTEQKAEWSCCLLECKMNWNVGAKLIGSSAAVLF